MGTKLTLENENGKFSVEVEAEEMTLTALFDNLLEPVLRAAGYSQVSIDELLSD